MLVREKKTISLNATNLDIKVVQIGKLIYAEFS